MEHTTKKHKQLHVLVVEDNLDLQFCIKEILKRDVDMFFVASAEEAIAYIIKTPKIDKLLTDYNLEGKKTGADVIRAMRIKFQDAPIILMSAKSPHLPEIASILSSEKVIFLGKPFSNEKLLKIISTQ